MNKSSLSILIFFLGLTMGQAQVVFQPKPLSENRKGVLFEKELTFDFTLHTSGYNLGVSWGEMSTYYKTNFYYVGFGEIKHPKEYRQNFRFINPTNNQTSRSFVYGKQNNFFVLRAGKGFKRFYSEKAKEKGVAVSLSMEAGPTLGILKPVYLNVNTVENRGQLTAIKYTEETADDFLNLPFIFGSAGFAKGIDEVRFVPGLHGRIAVNFEWGAYDEFIKAAEVGLMLDVFPRTIPIMVTETNRPFFLNLYITLQLGRRS